MTRAPDVLTVQPVKEPGQPGHVEVSVRIPGLDVVLKLNPAEAVEVGSYLLRAASEAQ